MNIVEFSKTIGVGRATVYRVLSGDERVSAKTREYVLAKAKELDVRPSRSARALKTGRTHLVELWIPNLELPFSGAILAKVEARLNAVGFDIIVRRMDEEKGVPRYSVGNSLWPIDGVLSLDAPEKAIDYIRNALGRKVPIVNMGGSFQTSTDIVDIDHFSGSQMAVRHLAEDAGCRKITYIAHEADVRCRLARSEGVRITAIECGVEWEFIPLEIANTAGGWRAMQEYLQNGAHPDGLYCVNDSVALGAQSALIRHGVKIPDDTAMLGCDGLDFTEFMPIPITTLQAPIAEMCEQASCLLLSRMKDPSLPLKKVVLTPHLSIRESSLRASKS